MAKRRKQTARVKGLRGKYGGFIDPYRESYTTAQLEQYRRKYAKMVNQRLVRLERSKYKLVDSPALEYLGKAGRRRFSEQLQFKGSRNDLKREIALLTGFASSLRSTSEGIQQIVQKTSNTMRDRFGLDLDPSEMGFLLENFNDFKSAVKMNSDALLQAIGEVSGDITNKDQIKQIVKELKNKKTVESQADAIYKTMYGRKRKGKADKIEAIKGAIIR